MTHRVPPLRRSAAPSRPRALPTRVYSTHVAKPLSPAANTNTASPVGVHVPRPSSEMWEAAGYDPWSAGQAPFSTMRVPSLDYRDDNERDSGGGGGGDGGAGAGGNAGGGATTASLRALFSAVRAGNLTAAMSLVESPPLSGPSCSCAHLADGKGNTWLHVACQNGHKRLAKAALRAGADINAKNVSGNTPLHFCHAFGHTKLAQYLLDKGANDAVTNGLGCTVYEGLGAVTSRESCELMRNTR